MVFAALYFIVPLVNLLDMHCVYAHGNDPENKQFALNREPLAPALRKWSAARHEPRQWPTHVKEKRAFLNFVPCFGRGTIQDRRDINYHRLASRTGASRRQHCRCLAPEIRHVPLAALSKGHISLCSV